MQKKPHEIDYRFESDAFSVRFSFSLKEFREPPISPSQLASLTSDEPPIQQPPTKSGLGDSHMEVAGQTGPTGSAVEKTRPSRQDESKKGSVKTLKQ